VIDDAREDEPEESTVLTGHPDNGQGDPAHRGSALQQK
jgi:hypothetical protein